MRQRFEVHAPDGVRLAAWAEGPAERPAVLLVHGYPDTHRVWGVVADALAADWRVLRYDVRGAGESDRPADREAYALSALVADARAVVAAAGVPGRVHLVGHDWGSITGWDAVTAPDAAEWIASYTTVSGPGLDQVAAWTRARWSHPTPRQLAPLLRQQARSWYVGMFQVPKLPEVAWRRTLGPRWVRRLRRTEDIPPAAVHVAPTLTEDAVAGLNLYRANLPTRLGRRTRRDPQPAAVPVQFVVPLQDRYVSPALAAAGLDSADAAWWRTIDTGHWGALLTSGSRLAAWVDEFARYVDGGPETAGLAATKVLRDRPAG